MAYDNCWIHHGATDKLFDVSVCVSTTDVDGMDGVHILADIMHPHNLVRLEPQLPLQYHTKLY